MDNIFFLAALESSLLADYALAQYARMQKSQLLQNKIAGALLLHLHAMCVIEADSHWRNLRITIH